MSGAAQLTRDKVLSIDVQNILDWGDLLARRILTSEGLSHG